MKTILLEITGRTIIVFYVLFLLSGCATIQIPKPVMDSIDEFPVFMVADGPNIDPASDVNAVQDVDILSLSEDMKRLLDEKVTGIKNHRIRMTALVELISENFQFDTTEDKYGTKTASETFEAKSGNCLSFSNLLVSMARYAGFKSGFEEIPTAPTWIKDGEVLLFYRHIGAMIELDEPYHYVLDVKSEFGTEKLVVQTTGRLQYTFTPVMPFSLLRYTLDSVPTRSIPDRRAFSQYYNNIGSKYLSEGNSADAFRYIVKAIKVDPELSFIWSNLGIVYRRNNQPEAAEQAFLQALYLNRDRDKLTSMTIMSNLASLYSRQGRMEEAGIYEEKVRSYRNMNPYYHYYLGAIAFDNGRYEQSVEHFNKAIKRNSDEHLFYYALALAYFKLGGIDDAEKNIEKAIDYARDRLIEEYYMEIWDQLTQPG